MKYPFIPGQPNRFYFEMSDSENDEFTRAMQIKRAIVIFLKLQGDMTVDVNQVYANIYRKLVPGKVIFCVDSSLLSNAEEILDFVKNGGEFIRPRFK